MKTQGTLFLVWQPLMNNFSAGSAPMRRNGPVSLKPLVEVKDGESKSSTHPEMQCTELKGGSSIRTIPYRWPRGSRAPMLRIPASEVALVYSRALKLTIKRRDTALWVSSDAFMGIYKPLRKGCSGTNLWRDKSAAYFVPYFTQLSHSLIWFLFTVILYNT